MNGREDIVLTEPGLAQEADAKAYFQECFLTDKGTVHGSGGFGSFEEYAQWLAFNEAMKTKPVNPDWVRGSTLLATRKRDGRIVGMLNLRYELNESLLQTGGHIGYSVRPSERRKGYATQMLRQALQICQSMGIDPVLVTCAEDNAASAGVIKKCGGMLENTVFDEEDQEMTQRYWIRLGKNAQK